MGWQEFVDFLLIVSTCSVKQEGRSSAESKAEGDGGEGQRREQV